MQNKKISMQSRCDLTSKVCSTFNDYWRHMHPVPIDVMAHVYRAAYTDKEWAAMRYLRQTKPSMLNTGSAFDLFFECNPDKSLKLKGRHVSFPMPVGKKLPIVAMHVEWLSEYARNELDDWYWSIQKYRQLSDELRRRIGGMLGNPTGEGKWWDRRYEKDLDSGCNTANQVYRLWPELQPFLPANWKRQIQLASAKSRLPAVLGYRIFRSYHDDSKGRFCTVDEFLCKDPRTPVAERESFAQINDVLMRMSLAQDIPTPERYPTFHD